MNLYKWYFHEILGIKFLYIIYIIYIDFYNLDKESFVKSIVNVIIYYINKYDDRALEGNRMNEEEEHKLIIIK